LLGGGSGLAYRYWHTNNRQISGSVKLSAPSSLVLVPPGETRSVSLRLERGGTAGVIPLTFSSTPGLASQPTSIPASADHVDLQITAAANAPFGFTQVTVQTSASAAAEAQFLLIEVVPTRCEPVPDAGRVTDHAGLSLSRRLMCQPVPGTS